MKVPYRSQWKFSQVVLLGALLGLSFLVYWTFKTHNPSPPPQITNELLKNFAETKKSNEDLWQFYHDLQKEHEALRADWKAKVGKDWHYHRNDL